MTLLVHRPGLLTTVQDLGRWGHQSSGVPVAGPMDWFAHRLANLVIGNASDAAVLEITVMGPTLECETAARIAITGAPFVIRVNGSSRESPLVIDACAGTIIEFGECLAGARGYLAVSGGIEVPVVLGSRSTDLRARFGGFEGRALQIGDRLRVGTTAAPSGLRHTGTGGSMPRVRQLPLLGSVPARGTLAPLRVLSGPAAGESSQEAFRALLAGTYRVSSRSDRMGYRLEGGNMTRSASGAIITAPTVMGLVQLPPSGELVLLMADRQTTGGYAAVAVVIAADLPVAGQLAPGHALQFLPCTETEARRAVADAEARLARLEASVG
jgi:antagonist of KipI